MGPFSVGRRIPSPMEGDVPSRFVSLRMNDLKDGVLRLVEQ